MQSLALKVLGKLKFDQQIALSKESRINKIDNPHVKVFSFKVLPTCWATWSKSMDRARAMTPTPPWVTLLLPPSFSVKLRLNVDRCSPLMLCCKKAYWCCSAAEESRERKVSRTGSKEMSGTMPASRATKNSSWTVAGEGRHKLRPVRIMVRTVWFSSVQQVRLLSGFLTPCVCFFAPVISMSSPFRGINTVDPVKQGLYTHI